MIEIVFPRKSHTKMSSFSGWTERARGPIPVETRASSLWKFAFVGSAPTTDIVLSEKFVT